MKVMLFALAGLITAMPFVSAGNRPQKGDQAPDFSLKDSEGISHSVSQFKGSWIVLYFYPKDDTPGCTKEACNLRDNYSSLKDKGIVILGVSYDSSEKHRKFREKYDLPFPLLADVDRKVAGLYGVKGMLFAKRVTFLIDQSGVIAHVFDSVDVSGHAKQILDWIKTHKED